MPSVAQDQGVRDRRVGARDRVEHAVAHVARDAVEVAGLEVREVTARGTTAEPADRGMAADAGLGRRRGIGVRDGRRSTHERVAGGLRHHARRPRVRRGVAGGTVAAVALRAQHGVVEVVQVRQRRLGTGLYEVRRGGREGCRPRGTREERQREGEQPGPDDEPQHGPWANTAVRTGETRTPPTLTAWRVGCYGALMGFFARLLSLAVLFTAPSVLADVTPQNVASLVPKWTFSGRRRHGRGDRPGRARVRGYLDARVLALDPVTGAEIWSRSVGAPVTGRVLALDDGGICYGTHRVGQGRMPGRRHRRGPLAERNVSDPLAGVVWSAPVAANGRLFVGVAGLTDNPCTRGRLLALDLATGDELWRFYTVPEKVCRTDTAIVECAVDGDCPNGGPCETGVGGGVTATPAVDPDAASGST